MVDSKKRRQFEAVIGDKRGKTQTKWDRKGTEKDKRDKLSAMKAAVWLDKLLLKLKLMRRHALPEHWQTGTTNRERFMSVKQTCLPFNFLVSSGVNKHALIFITKIIHQHVFCVHQSPHQSQTLALRRWHQLLLLIWQDVFLSQQSRHNAEYFQIITLISDKQKKDLSFCSLFWVRLSLFFPLLYFSEWFFCAVWL